jgi:hypothetical protein
MFKVLPIHQVSFKQMGTYGLYCEKDHIKFEMELTVYEGTDFLYVVRFKKLPSGSALIESLNGGIEAHMQEDLDYRELTAKIVAGLNL